jgi:hypothetical protein
MNMTMDQKKERSYRIPLTDALVGRFADKVFSQPAPLLSQRTGLPYLLVYNIVHRRVKSVSSRHYRILFGETPSKEGVYRVDGTFFRKMVALWNYLHGSQSKNKLYRELLGETSEGKIDYRIFSGGIQTVPPEAERRMLVKFEAMGMDRTMVQRWIEEMESGIRNERMPYEKVRPHLMFLYEAAGIHPASLLGQVLGRYERGQLKSVSRTVYERALALRHQAQKALDAGEALNVEKLREQIYGPKTGYVLYSEVAECLHFLKAYAKKGSKRYLGRSEDPYKKGKIKHVAAWRAQRISAECDASIRQRPDLPLSSLPKSHRTQQVLPLMAALMARTSELLSRAEGLAFEKQVLRPRRDRDEYKKQIHGFTQFDRASLILGMKKRAFDLMVATNCEIFREVGTYDRRWYLSDLYLKELVAQQSFEMISVKYEMMARRAELSRKRGECMY